MIGFRYRRKAGSGVSSDGRGRLSSVNCGEMDSRDRDKKSSGGTVGTAKLEKDWAAERILRNDAVRLDLNDDLFLAVCVRSGDSSSKQS